MVGENKRDGCVFPSGVDEGLPPITVADDQLEKMNALGGADDEVNRRKQASEEVVTDKDQATPKKPRYIWTHDVHNCFLDAIKQLGFKTAVPTKILKLMNVEGLTRENVASHLQKYRLQVKRRDQERAQARAASENVPKAIYPHMSGIPQQPYTMQGINMDRACLDGSQQAPSFANHNLNMIQGFPTVHGTPFKDLFDEGVNRMSSVRLVHSLYDSNGPQDINKIGYNYGPLPSKPLVDSNTQNSMDRHDATLVPQYDRRDELSLQYDQRDELSRLGVGVSRPREAIGGLIRMKIKELGVGMPRQPTGVLGMKFEGLGLGVPRVPESTGIKVEGHVTRLPERTGGFVGMKFEGLGAGVTHLPVPGLGVSRLTEAGGGLPEMNGLQKGFSFELESDLGFSDSWVDMKGDVDNKSFDYDLFWR